MWKDITYTDIGQKMQVSFSPIDSDRTRSHKPSHKKLHSNGLPGKRTHVWNLPPAKLAKESDG